MVACSSRATDIQRPTVCQTDIRLNVQFRRASVNWRHQCTRPGDTRTTRVIDTRRDRSRRAVHYHLSSITTTVIHIINACRQQAVLTHSVTSDLRRPVDMLLTSQRPQVVFHAIKDVTPLDTIPEINPTPENSSGRNSQCRQTCTNIGTSGKLVSRCGVKRGGILSG